LNNLLLKPILYLFFIGLIFASCKSTTALTKKTERKENRETEKLVADIIDSAAENLGVKYKSAGTTKSGFDCSGLVYSTFGKHNISLPRTSFNQAKQGTPLGSNLQEARKGDLIFFKTNSRSQINHVGIVTEIKEDEVQFIHSSTSKGVIISSTKEPYYKRSFVQLNRILN
jgi:cell wall-associated NlpC family hydrolase